ncbi:MAG: hypothetical protein Q9163_001396 [Psora crenata]
METAALEIFLLSQWTTVIERSKMSLDLDDLETIDNYRSWEDVQERLVAEDPETLGKIPRMVKSLAHKAEAFNGYYNEAQVVSNPMKEACFDMQNFFLDFFTDSIIYIHRAKAFPHPVPKLRCLMLPQTKTTRFFDRVDVFEKLDRILGPAAGTSFQSVALHGLGGVGKSIIASTYIEKRFDEKVYDVILWIRGEKSSSLRQSFTDIAMRLKLPGAQPQIHDENFILVHDWFQSTGESRFCKAQDSVVGKLTSKP